MSEVLTGPVAVVDDDEAVLDALKFLLEMAGFAVKTYPSGASFLANAQVSPRCLIVDQHMPSMTGLQLVTELRKTGNHIPVMLITAAPSPGIAAVAANIGIQQVTAKPPPEADLITFVTTCCRSAT